MSSQRHFYLDGTGDYLTTPDAAGFSAPGDFSIVARLRATDWTPANAVTVASHYGSAGNRSYRLTLVGSSSGTLRLTVSTDGTAITSIDSTVAPSFTDGTTYWVLMTRASSSGDVKFYTAADNGSNIPPAIGSFTQLGTTVTSTTGTLYNSTDTLYVGATTSGTFSWNGNIYRVTIYSGIYGSGSESRVADMLADDYSSGSTFTASTTGETWTLNGNTRGDINVYPDAAASGTGTANNAAASVKPSAGSGSATGTANNATTSVALSPSVASGTGTANSAAASVKPNASAATATGTANNAATSVQPNAGAASGAGTANNAATSVSVYPAAASATGTANNASPTTGTFVTPASATGTGTANDAAVSVQPSAGAAAATGTANDAAPSVSVYPEAASATGTANGATTSGDAVTTTTEQPRFGGGPISKRDLDRMVWEQQLERLLREDEEILCLV